MLYSYTGEAAPTTGTARLLAPAGNRPCALRSLIFNQVPVAGRCSTRWRIPPTDFPQSIINPPVLRFLLRKKLETVPGAGTLPVWRTGGRSAPGRRRQSPGEAMPLLRQAGLLTLSGSRLCALRGLIFNQAPVAGRIAHNCLRRARRFALATRPATCRCGKSPLDRIQPILIPPVLRFLLRKKLETVPGAGTLPVWGTGGRSAPGRRRLSPRVIRCPAAGGGGGRGSRR